MVANPIRWTIHDLEAMPDDGGWKRYEIIEGELLVTRAPHIRHQGAANKISTRLEVWSEKSGLGSPFQTPGVVFTETDAVIPDVVWASKARLASGMDEVGHFVVAPELMVEVLSAGASNEQRDKKLKLKLYSLHGVQEYWIANWQLKELELYRREDAMLKKVATLMVGDTLTSPLLPGFECAIARLFPA
ncbi:MAG: Uma2 family endonuclease [Phormidesmis sp.]